LLTQGGLQLRGKKRGEKSTSEKEEKSSIVSKTRGSPNRSRQGKKKPYGKESVKEATRRGGPPANGDAWTYRKQKTQPKGGKRLATPVWGNESKKGESCHMRKNLDPRKGKRGQS